MRVKKGKAPVPAIGRVWLNCSPVCFGQLRGRVLAVFAFSFIGCVDPVASALHATSSPDL